MSGKKSDKQSISDENRERWRKAQADKFAWIKAAGADRTIRDSTYRVLSLCAIHEAGHKGHWIGKRRHLAKLCGVTVSTFDRATAEGVARNYIEQHTDPEDRRAHKYHIVTVDERNEMFYEALNDWRREYREWLDAERQFIGKQTRDWLKAEKQFAQEWLNAESRYYDDMRALHRQAYDIAVDRGQDHESAYAFADQVRDLVMAGRLRLGTVQALYAMANETACPAVWQMATTSAQVAATSEELATISGQLDEVVVNRTAATCENVQSPYAEVLQVPQVLQCEPAAPRAERALRGSHDDQLSDAVWQAMDRQRARAAGCKLCYGSGAFLNPDGDPVVLTDAEYADEQGVLCQHSMAGNLAEIRRIEGGGFWLSPTGWPEIDSQYREFADVPPVTVDGTLTGAALQLNDPLRLGEQ
ncbi:hypothetical protein AWC11_12025 [Mycobacterium interjectum]|nr:hypothetical protein AWC11_12025 [Mycobacterium interjectum]